MKIASVCLIIALLLVLVESKGRGGGGGGRSGGGRGGFGLGRGGGRSSSSSRRGYTGGRGGTLKKAAVLGAAAYGGYQISKATTKFALWSIAGTAGWRFDDWNTWRSADGMLCRTTSDCSWIDNDLQCQNYDIDFSPSRAWFGGDYARIVGSCECRVGQFWNDYELRCDAGGWGAGMIFLFIVLGLLGCGILCCACYCLCK